MRRTVNLLALTCVMLCVATAQAGGIDDLRGKFTFNWFTEPDTVACSAIGDDLLSTLKSSQFTCNLTPITNTASGFPAEVCTETGGGREYLIFATQAQCEEERQTQASNE